MVKGKQRFEFVIVGGEADGGIFDHGDTCPDPGDQIEVKGAGMYEFKSILAGDKPIEVPVLCLVDMSPQQALLRILMNYNHLLMAARHVR